MEKHSTAVKKNKREKNNQTHTFKGHSKRIPAGRNLWWYQKCYAQSWPANIEKADLKMAELGIQWCRKSFPVQPHFLFLPTSSAVATVSWTASSYEMSSCGVPGVCNPTHEVTGPWSCQGQEESPFPGLVSPKFSLQKLFQPPWEMSWTLNRQESMTEKRPRIHWAGRLEKMREGRMMNQKLVHNEYPAMSCDGAHPQPAGLQGAARLRALCPGSRKHRDAP